MYIDLLPITIIILHFFAYLDSMRTRSRDMCPKSRLARRNFERRENRFAILVVLDEIDREFF